jgi:hypothetical protein
MAAALAGIRCDDDRMDQMRDREPGRISVRRISGRYRAALAATGLASWFAGGAASFLSNNGAGAAALVAVGGACGVLGLMGRWPSRISMSGNEFSWEDVDQTVDSQIQVAEQSGEADTVLAELKNLRERLNVLQRTGSVPEHPAQTYDRAVEAAIRRLLPGAEVTRQQVRSREVADFVVRYHGNELYVETKWRSDPAQPFGGSTLPRLLERLPSEAKLLIVVNTSAAPLPRAYKMVEAALGDRGRIVKWQDVRDDSKLGEALRSLLPDASGHRTLHEQG